MLTDQAQLGGPWSSSAQEGSGGTVNPRLGSLGFEATKKSKTVQVKSKPEQRSCNAVQSSVKRCSAKP
eukprot:6892760-Pyramimonas_sp.AAC.1